MVHHVEMPSTEEVEVEPLALTALSNADVVVDDAAVDTDEVEKIDDDTVEWNTAVPGVAAAVPANAAAAAPDVDAATS